MAIFNNIHQDQGDEKLRIGNQIQIFHLASPAHTRPQVFVRKSNNAKLPCQTKPPGVTWVLLSFKISSRLDDILQLMEFRKKVGQGSKQAAWHREGSKEQKQATRINVQLPGHSQDKVVKCHGYHGYIRVKRGLEQKKGTFNYIWLRFAELFHFAIFDHTYQRFQHLCD